MPNSTANLAINEVLDFLRVTHHTVFIPAVVAGKEIGLAEKTTRNMLSEGRFPLRTVKVGAKRLVSIFVLADFVARQSLLLSSLPPKRGPRFKKDRLALGRSS